MKKVTTIIAAVAFLFATSAFATPTFVTAPETATETVKAAFTKDFSKAVNATWKKTENFYFVSFMLNEKNVTVAYAENGELMGTSRVIGMEDLPISLSLDIAKTYKGYELGNSVTEISSQGQTYYYFDAQNSKQALRIKSDINGNFTIENKVKK